MKILKTLVLGVLLTPVLPLQAADPIDFDAGFFGQGVFLDVTETPLSDGNIVRFGYSSSSLTASDFSSLASATDYNAVLSSGLFDGFVGGSGNTGSIEQSNRPVGAATSEAVLNGSATSLYEQGGTIFSISGLGSLEANLNLYLFVFNQMDPTNLGGTKEFGIYTSSNWQTRTSGLDQGLTSGNIDTIIRGTQVGDDFATAVPEPATYAALFGVVALGIAIVRRRMQRQRSS